MNNRLTRAFHPGYYVKESIESLKMTIKEFSYRTGITEKVLSDLVNQKSPVTFDTAQKLEQFYHIEASVWLNMQTAYDKYLLEIEKEKELEEDYKCLSSSTRKYLVDYQYINSTNDKNEIVEQVRNKIKVNRLTYLINFDFATLYKKQANSSDNFERNLWVALALNKAREIEDVKPFSKQKALKLIPQIYKLMDNPDYLSSVSKLTDLFKEVGIAFVYLPYLKKSNLYGATKWLPNKTVMMAISDRNKSHDSFYLSLFHELAHVIQGHKRYFVISEKIGEDKEANQMAVNWMNEKLEKV